MMAETPKVRVRTAEAVMEAGAMSGRVRVAAEMATEATRETMVATKERAEMGIVIAMTGRERMEMAIAIAVTEREAMVKMRMARARTTTVVVEMVKVMKGEEAVEAVMGR